MSANEMLNKCCQVSEFREVKYTNSRSLNPEIASLVRKYKLLLLFSVLKKKDEDVRIKSLGQVYFRTQRSRGHNQWQLCVL